MNLLTPHGQRWEDRGEITENINEPSYYDAGFNWQDAILREIPIKSPENYFYLMFPMTELQGILEHTNRLLTILYPRSSQVSKGEFIKWLGIRLQACLENVAGNFEDNWSTAADSNTLMRAGSFGERFGMSRDRWRNIREALRFTDHRIVTNVTVTNISNNHYITEIVFIADILRCFCNVLKLFFCAGVFIKQDPWSNIRYFITCCNKRWETVIRPGTALTIDEIMSAWYGLDGAYAVEGLPHVTKIARKPEGVGCEMKALCDGSTKCMLAVEIQEGKEVMAQKEYQAEHGGGCAITLRLTKKYFGSGRVIIGDSAFASVKTLIQLHRVGLYFIGLVKTAHRLFPKQFLNNWFHEGQNATPRARRGRHKVLISSYKLRPEGENSHTMAAVGWGDSTCKTLISNVSNTLPGSPADRPRHKLVMRDGEVVTEQEMISIPRPKCVEFMFNYFSIIDVHDHLRQGSLAMERRWRTVTWWHRVFTTMIGVIFTNAYYAYCFEYRAANYNDTTNMDTYSKFLERLAKKLIFNIYLQNGCDIRNADAEEEKVSQIREHMTFLPLM